MNRRGSARFPDRRERSIDVAWAIVLVAMGGWVFYRMGGFDLWTTVAGAADSPVRIAKTFGGVDHPFHATRADLLRRALANGDLLRWISAHQGGYPVEFYPLGAPALEVVLWAALLGMLPMMVVHKIAVIVIFLLPLAGFLLLSRFDRSPIGVAALALAFHVSARGWWWSGGYMELVDWGLVSSFLAMTAVLCFLPVSFVALRTRSVRWAGFAGMAAAFAVYTNVRSFLPLAAIGVGTLLSLAWESDRRLAIRQKTIVAGGILALGGLLLGPLLISILRFRSLYYFVIYERYDSFSEYWQASVTAVSGPIFALAIIGFVAVFFVQDFVAGRLVALTLIAYVTMTILLSGLTIGPNIEQLEAIRLMPLQRALMLYLAALGVYAILRGVSASAPRWQAAIVHVGLFGMVIVTFLLYVVLDSTPIHASDRGLYPVLMTGESFFLDQQHAVELADERAERGTSILVLGTNLSWHDQFWSFQWSDRPFFFDDWLWYWQEDHFGLYDPEIAHAYPDPASTLAQDYLRVHGIGAVIVTGDAATAAANSPLLEALETFGSYGVYAVKDPVPIITALGTDTMSISMENQRFSADVAEPATMFQIRRNWFPRWTATVDGKAASIAKDENGYMVVTASNPGTHVEVVYEVDGWDWLGRVMLLAGIAGAAIAIVQPRRVERLLRIEPVESA